ncbi:DUF2975 domain-containing protein [Gracilibacillus xinjiangensis]|uniref:DUF2975 domain-containing protein n=1 Tax=Gracilibacillus xinjiangensis TaxID=1193282 RepID=A0ABV8WRJ6_9BACI
MNRIVIIFLKLGLVSVGLTILGLSIFALPKLASYSVTMYPEYSHLQYPVLFGIYLTTLPFFYAIIQSWQLLNNVSNDRSFSSASIRSLVKIKYCALLIIAIYTVGMAVLLAYNALHPGIALVGIAIIFTTLIIVSLTILFKGLVVNSKEMSSLLK